MAEAPLAAAPPADAPAARPERPSSTALRLRQLSFGSQVKLVLVLAIPTAAMIAILLLLEFAYFTREMRDSPFLMGLFTPVLSGTIFAGFIAILQIAALGLLRLLPWRGPELKVEAPRHLAGIFE